MIHILLEGLARWIVACISFLGYPGVAFLMLLESACILLPSEIIMPFSGYLVSTGRFSLPGVVLAGSVGNLLGALLIYILVKDQGRVAIEKYGRYVFLSPRHLEDADAFFRKYGSVSVFIGRMLPIVRTFISLPAGITRVPFVPFSVLTFLGSIPWCFGLAYVGVVLGKNWVVIGPYFHKVDYPILALLAGGIAWWVWKNKAP